MLDEEVTRVLAGMEPANSQARCGMDPWDLILIVSDNGTELTSNAILAWSKDHKVEWHNIARKANAEWMCRELQQSMRDELLNESVFFGLDHARSAIAEWVEDYNHIRPHSSLGYHTPADYAGIIAATGSNRYAT